MSCDVTERYTRTTGQERTPRDYAGFCLDWWRLRWLEGFKIIMAAKLTVKKQTNKQTITTPFNEATLDSIVIL